MFLHADSLQIIEDALYFRPRDFIQNFSLDTNKLLDMYHVFDKVEKNRIELNKEEGVKIQEVNEKEKEP